MKSLNDLFSRAKKSAKGCWVWLGGVNSCGYGVVWLRGVGQMYAHRAAWWFEMGRRPGRRIIAHSCDNPRCINPSHLWSGTQRDNLRDMAAKKRHRNSNKTHCPKGHAYKGHNLILRRRNGGTIRECRTCHNASINARNRLQAAERRA